LHLCVNWCIVKVTKKRKDGQKKMSYIAKPTREQLAWYDMELGVIIHYCMEIYDPSFTGYKTAAVRERLAPSKINPTKLDAEQWVRSAYELGAKYAVLVANHCTGFSLWQTKENDYCTSSLKWKDGKGDICRDFIEACKKYGLKPGLYYSCGCNGYYDIDDSKKMDYHSEKYQDYVRHVEAQVKELWTEYGELFEIWFDGGVISPKDGGPDLVPLLEKYQPHAICFQGPKDYSHNIRWVGNEDGLAPENCWSTTNAGDVNYDGTVSHEEAGIGAPDGIHYWPAETDMPNRNHQAFGGGWGWKAGEEDKVFTPEYLLDCYIRSVGRNSNLLLGMAISTDGDFQDEQQFRDFGKLIVDTFGTPLTISENVSGDITLTPPAGKKAKYLVIREDITDGQHIRDFTVSAGGKQIYESQCVGHKRIVPLEKYGYNGTDAVTFSVKECVDGYKLRDVALY
jgi:alpha-L-fucosidase